MILLLVTIPLLAAFAILFGAPSRLTAILSALMTLVLAIVAAIAFGSAESASAFAEGQWEFKQLAIQASNFSINLHFGLTGISTIMMLLTAIVTLAAVLSGKAPEDHKNLWYSASLFIAAGAMGAFISKDLFFFYAFHELALIPTFLMIGMLGRGDRKHIAWKATIYLAAGSIVLLAGLVWLASIAGTYEISQLKSGVAAYYASNNSASACVLCGITGMLIFGYGTLVSLFPFHSWAAPAYASAPAPVAMLHAGVLKKFGLYGLIITAVNVIPHAVLEKWVLLLVVLLLCNIIWVGLVTINQKRIDLMLGNSSVMHMGYIFLAIAAVMAFPENDIAIPAAVLLMFAHGISIAMSFSLTDVIERNAETLEFNQLGGIAKTAPKLCFLFGLVGMASIGLPGLANFAGEVMVFFSGFNGWDSSKPFGPVQWGTVIALWGVVISAVYMLRAIKNTFHGELIESAREMKDISLMEQIPALLLGGVLLVVGVYPNILLQFLN